MNSVLIGIFSCGFIATIAYIFSQWIGGKSDILNATHKITQKFKEKEIKQIEKKQKGIQVQLKKGQQISEDTKKKIRKVQKKAAEEIKEVLKEDESVSDMLDDFNDDLDDF